MLRAGKTQLKQHSTRSNSIDIAVAALPFALIFLLLLIYVVSPAFYLEHVLHPINRETQAVEIITVACGILGGLLLSIATVRIWLRDRNAGKINNLPGSALLVGVAALATLFFAGEEVSWGQTWFGGEIPNVLEEKVNARERNLHNSDIPVQSLGSAYLVGMFIILPVAWMMRSRRIIDLPNDWGPAIARWPVLVCIATAICWKTFKESYLLMVGEEEAIQRLFYIQFVEQINEQKEMLIAIALLMYGVYLLKPPCIGSPMSENDDVSINLPSTSHQHHAEAKVAEATVESDQA